MKNKCLILLPLFLLLSLTIYSQKVHFYTDGSFPLDYLSLIKEKPFKSNQFYLSDSRTVLSADIRVNSPLGYLISGGRGFYIQRLYMTPGDSLIISMESVKQDTTSRYLKFSGKNSAHYNYYAEEFFALQKYQPRFREAKDLDDYKEKVIIYRDKGLEYLNQAISKNNLSDGFIKYMSAEIQNRYTFWLYSPLISEDVKRSHLPPSYLDSAFVVENEGGQIYSAASEYYIRGAADNIYNDLDGMYEKIKREFSGKQLDYMTATMIGIYALKQNSQYKDRLNAIIDSALISIKNPDYKEYIQQAHDFYNIKEYFPDNVLDSTYLRAYGSKDSLSLRKVLNIYKDKPLYIDMWASWCGPCRYDISKSQEVKSHLRDVGIEYIYFSIDTRESAWLKASEDDKITENQYMICDIYNSPITNFLSFNFIPFYVLMDESHKIKNTAAPSPLPENLEEIKEMVENMDEEKVVVYF